MTPGFASLRRITALSVVITLVAAPIAMAQSPESGPALAQRPLLNSTAFARLIQVPQADRGSVSVVTDPSRFDLTRELTAAVARQPQAAPTKAPERSWVSRHKWAVIIPAVVFVGIAGAWCMFGDCSG